MSVAARVDSDHVELPPDAVELLRHARPADQGLWTAWLMP
jgi:hypothetical protein